MTEAEHEEVLGNASIIEPGFEDSHDKMTELYDETNDRYVRDNDRSLKRFDDMWKDYTRKRVALTKSLITESRRTQDLSLKYRKGMGEFALAGTKLTSKTRQGLAQSTLREEEKIRQGFEKGTARSEDIWGSRFLVNASKRRTFFVLNLDLRSKQCLFSPICVS